MLNGPYNLVLYIFFFFIGLTIMVIQKIMERYEFGILKHLNISSSNIKTNKRMCHFFSKKRKRKQRMCHLPILSIILFFKLYDTSIYCKSTFYNATAITYRTIPLSLQFVHSTTTLVATIIVTFDVVFTTNATITTTKKNIAPINNH